MKRKIVKQGNSALTLTLPKEWTKKLSLKPGDELEVEEVAGSLKISPEMTGDKAIELNLEELNETLIWTYIIASYRLGYNSIKVKFNKQDFKIIQRVVDALLGMAITQQQDNTCVIKDLSSSPSDKEFANIFRRIFYLLEEMGESSLMAIKNKDKDALKNIEFQDYSINKFSNFCLRVLNKKNISGPLEYIISELENLGDEYARISMELSGLKTLKINPDILKIYEEINQMFVNLHKWYYTFSNQGSVDIVEHKNKINKMIDKINPKTKEETILLFHLSKIVHLMINIGERVITIKLMEKE
jgi:phosphate uptake regulator